jgi:polyhydroxyalkanoate synthesis repressor PhaR
MPSARRTAAPALEDESQVPPGPVRTLKKYPNRRLYDTQTSSYITLADVKQMVLGGEDFLVRDAKSGEDLTRSILLQIILEEESGGVPMFSAATLSQIIRFYGHAMQGVMGTMLEKNMAAFAELQNQFVSQSKGLYDPKHLSPEVWTQFMTGQAPAMQSIMGSYLEQSRAVFEKMQQAGSLFPGIAGFPGVKK